MINNEIIKWEPIDSIPIHLYFDKIIDDDNGLTIYASNDNPEQQLMILFKSVICYQSINETNSLKRLDLYPLLSIEWPMFVCLKSNYIDWLVDQSYDIVEKNGLNHYIITHGNGILDVISYQTPELLWID